MKFFARIALFTLLLASFGASATIVGSADFETTGSVVNSGGADYFVTVSGAVTFTNGSGTLWSDELHGSVVDVPMGVTGGSGLPLLAGATGYIHNLAYLDLVTFTFYGLVW
ncbi:MAG: hypothetical protein DIZ77_10880 [endosymbiont of Seepiophila jonesi]|uniref:PEP-CTERM sorting domain-containing protein n=1 Tax=endosymbiont of Lamellibrachia luymesi TaxID=2200907 RepID=A0A370E0Z4_9GAMM|nr:MAG: hypothetical protein DIZ77_10880 [endosymbiont of Seepiophila jonesi]RDH93228.1 MAG: hypothetical protein DIZ79_01320 [endosymbiont of Lamellibrachia luymesi]